MFSWIRRLFTRRSTTQLLCQQSDVLQAVTLLVTLPGAQQPLTTNEGIFIAKMVRQNWPLLSLLNELRDRRRLPPLPEGFDLELFRVVPGSSYDGA